jgi:hypothetical protein
MHSIVQSRLATGTVPDFLPVWESLPREVGIIDVLIQHSMGVEE